MENKHDITKILVEKLDAIKTILEALEERDKEHLAKAFPMHIICRGKKIYIDYMTTINAIREVFGMKILITTNDLTIMDKIRSAE